MLLSPTARDWARKLLAEEAASSQVSPNSDSATFLVYERSRQRLSASIGLGGFRALAVRALTLAKVESRGLDSIQIMADGSLCDLDTLDRQSAPKQDGEGGVILIAHLLGLFLNFLGETTTRQLVHDVVPTFEVPIEKVISKPFDGILQEVINLRSVSEALESLANEHTAAEAGLLIISANVRDIATILDVFAVVRNASDTVLSTEINESVTPYLM